MTVKAKKYLGQHFLLDNTVSQKIAEAIKIENKVNLLEIGPGTGALTQFLMGENINLVTYELDNESIIYLNKNFFCLSNSFNIYFCSLISLLIDKSCSPAFIFWPFLPEFNLFIFALFSFNFSKYQ